MLKKRAPFLFLRLLCALFTDLKHIWQYCSKGNLQQNAHFKSYIDAWYIIVNQAPENTPSRTTVDINITQQNQTLKLVTQTTEKIRSDQVFKMSSTNFHTSSSIKNMTYTSDSGKQRRIR